MEIQTQPLTIEAFMERFSAEGPFEYIDGEFVPMSPQAARSGRYGGKFYKRLSNHVENHDLGEVFIEVPFVLTLDDTDWVKGSRVPDVMFVSKARLAQLNQMQPDWDTGPLRLAPGFIAEVVSPSDKFSDVHDKVQRYLADGVPLVWVLDPQRKSVIVYRAGSNVSTTYSSADTVSAADIIPDFELSLNNFYGE